MGRVSLAKLSQAKMEYIGAEQDKICCSLFLLTLKEQQREILIGQ